jgi:protein farnesyltransferase subunit beta
MNPPIRDELKTETSERQDEVAQECAALMASLSELPSIHRKAHKEFIKFHLGRLPPGYLPADSSRPWFLYWSLASLALLGDDGADEEYRARLALTARAMRNASGGFGAGFDQLSHLATTYAVILAMALVGGEDVYEVVDRRAMWKWLGQLKCPDGGFRLSLGGEEDIR